MSQAPTPKRLRPDEEDDDDSFPTLPAEIDKQTALLTTTEVSSLDQEFFGYCETLLKWLANDKDTERKKKLRIAIKGINRTYNTISSAFAALYTTDNLVNSIKDSIEKACNSVVQASDNLSKVTGHLSKTAESATSSALAQLPCTYANVAGNSGTRSAPVTRISFQRGKSFPVRSSNRLIVGPKDCAAAQLASSKATKDALIKSINPTALNLQVHRVSYGPKNSVILEGDALDPNVLGNCEALSNAGLEIKSDFDLKPRLVIHDIPVDVSKDEIVQSIVQQNTSDCKPDEVKLIYLYPARNKKHRSCIVETSARNRIRLLSDDRINIGWTRCRIEDHISILQCYKCQEFGHIANACQKDPCCSYCAGNHQSIDCKNRSNLRCINCSSAGSILNISNHAASDKAKCPILRRKIERKISTINYVP